MIGGTDNPGSGDAHHAAASLHCVLWHPAGVEAPEPLLASLTRRRVRVDACDGSLRAVAHACRLEQERLAAHRAGDDARQRQATVLCLIEPDRLDDAAEVVHTLRMHAPKVVLWRYEAAPEDRRPLRPLRDDELDEPAPRPVWQAGPSGRTDEAEPDDGAPKMRATPNGPYLRLAGDPTPWDVPVRQPDTEHDPAAQLTEAELAMLLSDDPASLTDDPGAGRGGGGGAGGGAST